MQHFKRLSEQLGSNPGGLFDAPDGRHWYVKHYEGANGADRARNEQLTAELYKLAGVPHADVRLTEWHGKPAIASPFIHGRELEEFEPRDYASIKDLREHFPIDAWLSNFDAMGTNHNNVVVTDDNVAVRIDAGAGLRYRAKGKLKRHFNGTVDELEGMKDPELNPWIAKVYKGVKVSQDDPSFAAAARLALIPDNEIIRLVAKYGPASETMKRKLIFTLIERREDIAERYGLQNSYIVPSRDLAAIGHGDAGAGRRVLDSMLPGRAAGDQHVLHPAIVRDLGDGDLEHGAAILDRFISMAQHER